MTVAIVGGSGFVGLNIAAHLAGTGRTVLLLDRRPPPEAAWAALGSRRDRITFAAADVTVPETLTAAIRPGVAAVISGAAITADAERDAAEPERILAVNLMGLVATLRAAKGAGAARVINLSSAAALGAAGHRVDEISEELAAHPIGLYPITKLASERVAARLGALWGLDVVSVRLSTVFGTFEHATGVRDTLSPLGQIMMAATRGAPALLPRPGMRDWIYAPDVADAVARLLDAPRPAHRLYNVTTGQTFSALAWGEALGRLRPGFTCRLAAAGETPTIDLFGPTDRAPMSPARLATELGWRAVHDLDRSAGDFDAWARAHGAALWGTA